MKGGSRTSRDSVAMIGAIATVAFIIANVAHHVLGHSMVCLAEGGRIATLTAYSFQ
jgi:hypothetical protein